MDRQDPFQLSSSRRRHREVSPAPQNARPKSIGCMSAVFRFLSKHNRRRRFLISGKKQESEVSNALPPNSPSSPPRNSSSDVILRSPTLPASMRSVYALSQSPENLSSQPALVARLMGLNEVPMVPGVKLTVAEKRRRLLGALEKCDEDLKALKSMIQLITSVGDENGKIDCRGAEESELEAASCGGLSSTVAELTRLNLHGSNAATNGGGLNQLKKRPGEEENINISFIERVKKETINYTKERTNERFGLGNWGSKAMEESVNEVCRDIDWGQKREIGRIGVALQDFICRDLIEETIIDFGFCCTSYQLPQPLPLESCKRMLRF